MLEKIKYSKYGLYLNFNVVSSRNPHPEWNGVQAASSGNCGIRDGLNGWSTKPCVQRLHTGKEYMPESTKGSEWEREKKAIIKMSFKKVWTLKKSKSWQRVKQKDKRFVLGNISGCDYCLVECFLTSDDTLCPPLTPEVSEAGNRISPQAKHWPDFFNDAAINPWNAQASKNSTATMQSKAFIFTLHIWLCLHTTIAARKQGSEKQLHSQTFTSHLCIHVDTVVYFSVYFHRFKATVIAFLLNATQYWLLSTFQKTFATIKASA